eukprot:gene54608-biopygen45039
MSFTLSPTQIARYQQDGFLVLPDFKPAADLLAVRARAEQIVAAFEPGERASIFSTHEQRRTADAYFLGSGDQIRCFFEEDAFDAAGQLRQAKAFGLFDDHYRGVGDVDADFDDCGRYQHREFSVCEVGHDRVLLGSGHLAVHQPDTGADDFAQRDHPHFGRRQIAEFGFRHQRADPEGLRTACRGVLEATDH